ncbi:hypothetical protein DERP_011740 [Dermatophagoides pteronyssinus]|uniref:Hillarin-like n=1 Tax=Dermatophagoides pteronyssinus TaxID=6956 RepID=A0ABQ8J3I7_DERPT|nr:hypothetical protein DERP_011740 [Dermatophagoides pteronyssinus]
MGCGVSSTNAQIVPVDDCPLSSSSTNGTTTTENSHHLKSVCILLPCRFVGNNRSSTDDINGNLYGTNINHSEVQTDLDIIGGFKCQYTQTDSNNMNDDEFDAMIIVLDELLINESINKNDQSINGGGDNGQNNNDVHDDDEDELLLVKHKTINSLRLQENHHHHSTKRFCNVAVQATKRKSTQSTQTKFGSIDHCFLSPLTDQQKLLRLSENLTKAIVDCKSTDLNNPDNDDDDDQQNLKKLLSTLDVDDDLDLDNKTNEEMIDTVTKTLSKFDDVSKSKLPSTNQRKNPNETLWYSKSKHLMKKQKVQDCIFILLDDIRKKKTLEQFNQSSNVDNIVKKRDVSLQTTNDILTDESPEYAARSPLCSKQEMIPTSLMFKDIDQKMLDEEEMLPDFQQTQELTQYICKFAKNDLFKIRALFIWIIRNIRYNLDLLDKNLRSVEILEQKQGTSKDYCRLFIDCCRLIGIRVKRIDGFVRDYHYRPGYHFEPGKDSIQSWTAVFVLNSWRFIDLTLAAGYIDAQGEFHSKFNEHYFLTDPSVMIWTHFPYNEMEENYDRWQLLDKSITLDEFNARPKVTELFFEYNLMIRTKIQNPLEFRISTEVKIGSHEPMRYKYKLYSADEQENSSLNYYVFCQLKEDRLVGSFMVQPPLSGRFLLKIFAKPEREMQGSQQDLSIPLNPIITILLECTKARKYLEPFPLNELPWGLTQKFYDYKLRLVNQKGPIIVTWGGRRRLILESNETMLITYSLYDSDSMEMDTRNIILRDDNGLKIIFTINPPRVGTFKFILFGMPKPKQKGKWRLPMLATFMIDCKLIKPPQHDEDLVTTANTTHTTNNDDDNNKLKK